MRRTKHFFVILWDAITRFNRNDGSAMAGYVAFSGLLSIFPFLIFATTLIGVLVGQERTGEIVDALFEIAPAHVARTLEPVVTEVLSGRSSGLLTLSAVFAIYVASNAVEALRLAFDRAYAVEPDSFLVNRLRAIVVVFVGAIVAALLGLTILLAPLILRLTAQFTHLQIPSATGLLSTGFGLLVFGFFTFGMHRYLPGRRMEPMTRVWPGVLLTALLWIIAATGFSTYLSFAPSYTVTYGTLAGVIITLMFFYITGLVIIFGAEFNAALNRLQTPARRHFTG
ncbi:YihY/virulence factor BrkB family protein [Rhodobacteraceae bacterium DSL-40]|uniref:YihY/virulence factor BrkB family protein n=1 Tax=Amaricoccus sp. B4 TaxID=3368557 RepID=UPI000DAD7E21